MTLENKEIITTKVTYIANGKEYSCELDNLIQDRLMKEVLMDYQRKVPQPWRDCPRDLVGIEKDNYQLESYGINIQTVEVI